jgi:ATP-binding protein involved in chromosome partitioning
LPGNGQRLIQPQLMLCVHNPGRFNRIHDQDNVADSGQKTTIFCLTPPSLPERSSRHSVKIMIVLTQQAILDALKTVKYPGYSRDVVSFGLVKEVAVKGGAASVSLQLTGGGAEIARQIKGDIEQALRGVPGVERMHVEVLAPAGQTAPVQAGSPFSRQARLPGLGRIVAIASGKGGVGKSTVSVNLACALRHLGAAVGLLDCDIYGPSIPLMMGIHDRPTLSAAEKLVPPESHGVKLMSMGFLIEGDAPVIWRGPMIMKTIQQFISDVEWGKLDFLLVDLPPGTGDAQLSLCQTVPLDGGVIVTTPQEAALGVVRKGIVMFEKVNVPILGIVENMSYFTAPNGERVELFGHGGGRSEAGRRKLPFLGEIPFYLAIRHGGDTGLPVVVSNPQDAPAQAFINIAKYLRDKFV